MLNEDSIKWAVDFIKNHSDGDLFPKILEIDAISNKIDDFVAIVKNTDLSNLEIGACRRFIVPKDEISYRQATQLDLQDSIILTALIYQYGQSIEDRRLGNDIVYSYRFAPDSTHGLYSMKDSWNNFWGKAYKKSNECKYVLYCDIADFYNQIYHHTLENQLTESGFPNQVKRWIENLIKSTTAGVSRGVPIGPHAIHLLAEATMIPIDNSLSVQGFHFIRYVDDIIVFFESKEEASIALGKIASTLDRQQRLMLQRHKCKIYEVKDFKSLCIEMIEDRPINAAEDKILKLVKKYSGGNPYITISYNEISEEDWGNISEEIICKIINEYLDKKEIDYVRLRWFYRRLSQIGHPGAIEISLSEMQKLGPCLANICSYLASVQSIDADRWKNIGSSLLDLLDLAEVKDNEYFKLSILSLFTKNEHINHFRKLIGMYSSSESFARREILLSAIQNSAYDWLREQKENFQNMDSWQKIAYIYSISGLPKDEKKYFISKRVRVDRPIEHIISKWSKDA